jgi:PAS domain S-box-containing protein
LPPRELEAEADMKYLTTVKEVTVTFRWLVILLLLLFLLYTPQGVSPTAYRWLFALFLLFIASNTVLSLIRFEPFMKYKLNFYVFLVDVFLISLTIYIIQGFDSDLFLIYFVIIFIATVGSTGLKRSLLIGLIAAVLYFGFYLRNNPFSSLLTSYMLLRVPFFFLLAFLSTFNSEQLKGEIAARRKAEEKGELVLERYKTLVQTIPDIIYELDGQGRFSFLSDSVDQLGYAPHGLLGKHFSIIIHAEDRDNVSSATVLARCRGKSSAEESMPKLFDERRTGNRMTKNLNVRLLLKTPPPDGLSFIFAEVHSSGKWSVDPLTGERVFAGSIGIIRDMTESTLDKLAILHKNIALESINQELTSSLKEAGSSAPELKQTQAQLPPSEMPAERGDKTDKSRGRTDSDPTVKK